MRQFVCEALGKRHDLHQFDCGNQALNDYLRKTASQDVKRKASVVYVIVPTDQPQRVVGFYTLCATSLELATLPADLVKLLPRYPQVPAILIGRLARDFRVPGIGSLLLSDALTRCVRVAAEIGATLIIVDSKGEEASRFYEKFGFIALPRVTQRMFLPIATAAKLI
ncbi:MAG: GNAT family N-acetyltransferase [Pirellula sp.]